MARDSQQSSQYVPTIPPEGDINSLREWLQRETWAIYNGMIATRYPGVQVELPLHPKRGSVDYFEEGVVSGVSPSGLYYFNGINWLLIRTTV